MKKLIIPTLAGLLLSLTACEGYLDGKNIYNKDLDSFYSTPTEIQEGVAGVYLSMHTKSAENYEVMATEVISDLMLSGGEPGGETCYDMDMMVDPRVDVYRTTWIDRYAGIYRANALIDNLSKEDAVTKLLPYFESEEAVQEYLNQVLGEAYFMRGYFQLNLARMFGGIPLILSANANRNVPRNTYTETFAQIIRDFKTAIDYLPANPAASYDAQYGRSNRWIAEGYIARAWMHYTGYMTNIEGVATSSIEIPAFGEEAAMTIGKTEILAYLDDCIDNSGYALLQDFRELWPYSAVNELAAQYGDPNGDNCLPWAKKATEYRAEGLKWAGQDGFTTRVGYGNSEVMFSIRYSFGGGAYGGDGDFRTSRMNQYFSSRDKGGVPFAQGWGWGTVHTGFLNAWDDADLRKAGSVLPYGDADHGTENLEAPITRGYTGFINKKYCNLVINGEGGKGGIYNYAYGQNIKYNVKLSQAQDIILLRFADVLLMKDELTETNTGMTQLRERAGLEAVPYSLQALKDERMHEFAFEGIRWYDLVRWGDAYNGNNFYADPIIVKTNGIDVTYSVTVNPTQKGLLPFPETEFTIGNGLYETNPGWE